MAKTKKKTGKKTPASGKRTQAPSNHEVQSMIAEAAYFKAERRNFIPGFEYQDWMEAESEITTALEIR